MVSLQQTRRQLLRIESIELPEATLDKVTHTVEFVRKKEILLINAQAHTNGATNQVTDVVTTHNAPQNSEEEPHLRVQDNLERNQTIPSQAGRIVLIPNL